jgi:RNA polymerase sigma-70 factor (ECF subfamily)
MNFFKPADTDIDTLFSQMFSTYSQRLFAYVYRTVGCRESAEDIVQEVFLKVYKHLPRYRDKRKMTAWVFTIARTTMLDHVRRNQTYHQVVTEVEDVSALESHTGDIRYSPQEFLATRELQEHFEKVIANLPPRQKEVFLLRHEAGLSFKDIAKLLRCPVNRLLGRMHLAVTTIRAEMRQFLNED